MVKYPDSEIAAVLVGMVKKVQFRVIVDEITIVPISQVAWDFLA